MLIIEGGHHQLGECSSSSLCDEGGAGSGPAPSEAQPLRLPPAHRLQVFRRDPSSHHCSKYGNIYNTFCLNLPFGWILAKPFPAVNWKLFLAPGIYADQQTGCQVFHFCQDGGRMDSFFCPNLTLFNQRFFVCDWWAESSESGAVFSVWPDLCFRSYNVDCNSAHLHYSLNDGLYKSQSAQTISNAINQPVGLAQVGLASLSADGGHYGPVNLAMNAFWELGPPHHPFQYVLTNENFC